MRAVTKWNARATSPESAAPLIAEGWREMTTSRRLPVHVEIPIDVLDMPVSDLEIEAAGAEPAAPDIAGPVARAADLLAGARRPLIYAGGGATSAAAGEAIVRIAETLRAPIVTSIQGKGSVPASHPHTLDALWTQGNAVDELARQADALLVVGSRLGVQATERFSFPIPDELVRIDIDPEEMTRNATPTVAIEADARLAAGQLADALAGREVASMWDPATFAATRDAARATAFGADRVEWLEAIQAAMGPGGCIAWDMTAHIPVPDRLRHSRLRHAGGHRRQGRPRRRPGRGGRRRRRLPVHHAGAGDGDPVPPRHPDHHLQRLHLLGRQG
jgi:acetolactate synthase-1/2/3 large subunit